MCDRINETVYADLIPHLKIHEFFVGIRITKLHFPTVSGSRVSEFTACNPGWRVAVPSLYARGHRRAALFAMHAR